MTPRDAITGTPANDNACWQIVSEQHSDQPAARESGNDSVRAVELRTRCSADQSPSVLAVQPISSDRLAGERCDASAIKTQVQRCIGSELAQVEKLIQDATSSRYAEVAELSRAAAAMGGKRLRPTLVWLSAQATNGSQFTRATRRDLSSIAAAVELVHAASLVHDDVMDAATHRRHQLTIAGKAGNSAAVLLGDLLFTRAYALAASCRSTYAARCIASASTRLCEGELRQQAAAGQWQMTLVHYRSLLLQKTGALCGVSCRLGSWRAGADAGQIQSLTRFGRLLGLAFQIHDDWLDYWGTEAVGKTLGTDLAQGKPTLPLIRLMQNTPNARQADLVHLLNDSTAEARQAIRSQLDACDAGDYTLRMARRCSDRAKRELLALPSSPARDGLAAVADYSVKRSA